MSQSRGLNIGQQRRKIRTRRRPWRAWYAQNCCKKQTGHHCLIAVQPQSTRLAANTKPWTDAGSVRSGGDRRPLRCHAPPAPATTRVRSHKRKKRPRGAFPLARSLRLRRLSILAPRNRLSTVTGKPSGLKNVRRRPIYCLPRLDDGASLIRKSACMPCCCPTMVGPAVHADAFRGRHVCTTCRQRAHPALCFLLPRRTFSILFIFSTCGSKNRYWPNGMSIV